MNKKQTITYQAREDFVTFRAVKVDKVGNIVVPNISAEGEKYIIESIGPKVEGLSIGDEVCILGSHGQNYMIIPGTIDLAVTRQSNICVIVTRSSCIEE